MVVVETAKGLELAECCRGNHEVDDKAVVQPLRPVIRAATESDLRVAEINRKREKEAFGICEKKILSTVWI
jgi:cell fate regulator YaaT (PSP1 superfamily)